MTEGVAGCCRAAAAGRRGEGSKIMGLGEEEQQRMEGEGRKGEVQQEEQGQK